MSEDLSKALAGQVLVAAYRTKSFDDIRPTLLQQYADHLVLRREENRVSQLLAWVKRDSAAQHPPTQKSLAKLWKVSQPAVSGAVAFLIGQGYVTQLPRRGAKSRGYLLTGISRLTSG